MEREREYSARVTFDLVYTVTDEGIDDILGTGTAHPRDPRSELQSARQHLVTLLDGWALADTPLIGTPGGSLEAVTITRRTSNVRYMRRLA